MAILNFNTANATFRQLLGNGLSYRVPPFQRDYSWTEDEWDDLWQDLQDLNQNDSESGHYMGYLVLQKYGHAFEFESATYDLEHILPENPSEAWSYIEGSKQEALIYRIGNMAPLETNRNRDLGNADYATKESIYAQSTFHITKAIAEHYDSWNEQKIVSRQKQLADVAAGIWQI